MGRIRSIKPEFPQSESMGRISRDARLLFIELWTIVDDSGRFRAASRMLASLLFPYDDDAPSLIDGWLQELVDQDCIVIYAVDGHRYLEVRNWSTHQKIDRPSASKFPPFVEPSRILASPRESSSLDQGSGSGSGTKEVQGPPAACAHRTESTPSHREEASEPEPEPASKTAARPDDVPEDLWRDWLSHRRRKRATVTETVVKGMRSESAAAGMTLADAIRHSITQGWQGFRAEWVVQPRASPRRAESVIPKVTPKGYYGGGDAVQAI